MAWPVRHLTFEDRVVIREVLQFHQPHLSNHIDHWPKDGCMYTCQVLLPDLRARLGTHGLRWKTVRGWFDPESESGAWGFEVGHVWIEIASGEIIDPTAGQFVGGPALHFIQPGDPRYLHFRR